ncbi:MAG: flagellar filament capping protein FliD [Spirochaetaceae bacterium]|jgi:flagellar hook-associated protein 2|nr:flagellar filament capping protein FliD [Spirochaetaceae bacterium]
MSDIYIPGIKSRFDTDKIVEQLMQAERIPKERSEKNIEALYNQKTYWQDVGRRMSSLRDSVRSLYSFQNPFSDRRVISSDESILTATSVRGATEQERNFVIKQTAQADRFLSLPISSSFKIDAGIYTFSVGKNEISFNFKGGTVQEWIDVLNRRGNNKIRASLVTVQPRTKSLLIESLLTGSENRLGFADSAADLAAQTGIVLQDEALREIDLSQATAENTNLASFFDDVLTVEAGGSTHLSFDPVIRADERELRFEVAVTEQYADPTDTPPALGPVIPSAGSVSYRDIIINNDPSSLPWLTLPVQKSVNANTQALSVVFDDGTSANLPDIIPSNEFMMQEYRLSDIAGDKTIVSLDIVNGTNHTALRIRNMQITDPNSNNGLKPQNPVSIARDAVFTMEGIEVTRPTNIIDDLVPGLTIMIKSASNTPVVLGVEPDREQIKNAIINVVGNYNQLMAELNVLTRTDDQVITELSYLTTDEQSDMRKRLGIFSADSTLNKLRSSLQRILSAPYSTSAGRDLTLLAQIGIGVDVQRSGGAGYDASRLRGYLEIDEKKLDAALQTQLPAVAQLFGSDTDGDLIVDSGIAYSIETLTKPFVETGGIIALKTSTIDSQISQDDQRIKALDRQLAAKEASLKSQYGQMESAYARMESMGTSLEQFSQQNRFND